MRITYLAPSTIPSRSANSIHVMKMCQAFAKNGYEVVLFAPDRNKDLEPGVDDVFKYYGIEENFRIIKLPWLPIKGRSSIYGYLAAQKARWMEPDIVYGRQTTACFFAARMGLSTIFESHEPINNRGAFYEWFFKSMVGHDSLKRLVVITRALQEYYRVHYPELDGKILVAPDAADTLNGSIGAKSQLLCSDDLLKVGYIGHLYAGRGIELLVELAKRFPLFCFHFLGGSEDTVTEWKNKTSSTTNVIFHGFVSPSETAGFRVCCDILVAPYQSKVSVHGGSGDTSAWMSPLKIFEYMAAGKAIICSDLPVLREVLTHEHNALLCPPDDINAWAQALERLRDDAVLRENLGRTAYQDFLQNYTWEARASTVLWGI